MYTYVHTHTRAHTRTCFVFIKFRRGPFSTTLPTSPTTEEQKGIMITAVSGPFCFLSKNTTRQGGVKHYRQFYSTSQLLYFSTTIIPFFSAPAPAPRPGCQCKKHNGSCVTVYTCTHTCFVFIKFRRGPFSTSYGGTERNNDHCR